MSGNQISEAQLQRRVLKMIRSEFPDIFTYKVHDMFTSGIPDVLGCCRSKFFAIELKRPGQKPRPLQEYVMEQIRNAGGYAIWATSVEECKQFLWKICAG